MGTVEKGLEAQIRNIEQRYGKPLSEWIAVVKESGLTIHSDIVAVLKSQFRRLLIRWDKKPANYLAFLHFACGLIAFRAGGLFG